MPTSIFVNKLDLLRIELRMLFCLLICGFPLGIPLMIGVTSVVPKPSNGIDSVCFLPDESVGIPPTLEFDQYDACILERCISVMTVGCEVMANQSTK